MSIIDDVETRKFQFEDVEEWYWHRYDTGLWHIRHELKNVMLPKVLEHVKGRDTVVQAGGAIGMLPRVLGNHFKTVYTFEPNPTNFYFLSLNCDIPNVVKMQAALGKDRVPVTIQDYENNQQNQNRGIFQVGVAGGENPVLVPEIAIDDLHLPACDAILLDVEEYEPNVLMGAENTIFKFRPVIFLECGNTRENTRKVIEDWFGYRMVDVAASDAIYVYSG